MLLPIRAGDRVAVQGLMVVSSLDLIRRLRETEVAYTLSRMRILFIRSIWTPLRRSSKETSP